MNSAGQWRAANNGTGARMWFVMRRTDANSSGAEYHYSAKGDLVRYGSYDSANRQAQKLNA